MSRTMKFMVTSKPALAASVEPILHLPIKRLIVAHDQIIEAYAHSRFTAAFAWLR